MWFPSSRARVVYGHTYTHCTGLISECGKNNCVPSNINFPLFQANLSDLYCATQDEVDFDFSWPWHTKTLLELVRGTGLHPEVNISGVQEYIYIFLRQILVLVYIRVLIDQILGSSYADPLLLCCFSIAWDLHYKTVCWYIQWTLAYPATMRPDHGQISEIAEYVNHHANSVYNVSLLALLFLFLSCYPSLVQTIIVFWPLQA